MPVDEDELDDRELPDPSDMDQDDDTILSRCPNCRQMIAEESEICPKCGCFISTEDAPAARLPIWVVVGFVLVVIVMVVWAVG